MRSLTIDDATDPLIESIALVNNNGENALAWMHNRSVYWYTVRDNSSYLNPGISTVFLQWYINALELPLANDYHPYASIPITQELIYRTLAVE